MPTQMKKGNITVIKLAGGLKRRSEKSKEKGHGNFEEVPISSHCELENMKPALGKNTAERKRGAHLFLERSEVAIFRSLGVSQTCLSNKR